MGSQHKKLKDFDRWQCVLVEKHRVPCKNICKFNRRAMLRDRIRQYVHELFSPFFLKRWID